MQGEEPDSKTDFGDLEALAGVRKFPVRVKCAALSWNVLEQGLKGSGG
jgi:nitrogen fixation NifU-like protein